MKVYLYKPVPAFHLVIEQLTNVVDVIRINQSEHIFHFTRETEAVLVLPPEAKSLGLIEKIRFEHKGLIPIVLLSHESVDDTAAHCLKSFNKNEPIIRFGIGTYHCKLPGNLSDILNTIENARPVPPSEIARMNKEYEACKRAEKDKDFRHRCAGLASAIRIFQGALYAKHVDEASYRFTIRVLRRLSERFDRLRPYGELIQDYLKEIPSEGELVFEDVSIPESAVRLRILLLDDEAESAGWSVVLKSVFEPHGLSFAFETDRDEFRRQIEEKDDPPCDILLLDLRMPGFPEQSVDLIERITDKFSNIVVIVFTAVNDIKYFNQCKAAGAFDYFVKELSPDDRNPLAYYKRLRWLIKRAGELVFEKRHAKGIETRIGEPTFYTCKQSIRIPVQEERMIVQEEWNSYFSLVVTSAAVAKEGTTAEIEDVRVRLISWLLREPPDGRHLSLRYIFDPDQELLTLALIGKGKAGSKEESLMKARSIYGNISYLLKGFSSYTFEVVGNQQDLFRLLEPFQPAEIVRFQRDETDLEMKEQILTAFYPFSFNKRTFLDKMISVLMDQEAPTMINIGLWPVALDKEKEWLAGEVRKARNTLDMKNSRREAVIYSDQGRARVSRRIPLADPDADFLAKQQNALKLLEAQLQSLDDGYMLGTFDLISSMEIPSMIRETIRYDFFGPRGKVRFERYHAVQLDELWGRMRLLDHQRPPKNGSVLRNLVGLSQAMYIFQLPIPGPSGVRGIKMESLNVIPIPKKYRKKIMAEGEFLMAEGFGKTEVLPVKMTSKDLMQHLYVCGRTGSGKSTFLLKLALSLVEAGKGVCLIDPHGDLALSFRELLPKERGKDVIFFNPMEPGCPVRLNLLENDGSVSRRESIYQEFMGMLHKVYSAKDHMGPAFERVLRPGFLLVMMAGGTLADLPRIWNDIGFRESCLEKIDQNSGMGQEVGEFFKEEFPDLMKSDWGKGFHTYILSKINRFISDETMRRVLSSPVSTIDFHKVLDDGKILVARLPKGPLGEINAYMLGMITSFKLRQAIMERGQIPEPQRKDFYFIIDEFQNFVSSGGMGYSNNDDPAFSSLLSEARKFKVSMTLANQYIHQLGAGMRNAVFGNIQSRILFGVGAEDAEFIKRQIPMGPEPDAYVSCPNYYAHAQLLVGGEQVGPFTIRTIVPE